MVAMPNVYPVSEHSTLKCVTAPGSEGCRVRLGPGPAAGACPRASPGGQFLGSDARYVLYCIFVLVILWCWQSIGLVRGNVFYYWVGDPLSFLIVLKIHSFYHWRAMVGVVGLRHGWVVNTLSSVFPCEDPGPTGTEAICVLCDLLVGGWAAACSSRGDVVLTMCGVPLSVQMWVRWSWLNFLSTLALGFVFNLLKTPFKKFKLCAL